MFNGVFSYTRWQTVGHQCLYHTLSTILTTEQTFFYLNWVWSRCPGGPYHWCLVLGERAGQRGRPRIEWTSVNYFPLQMRSGLPRLLDYCHSPLDCTDKATPIYLKEREPEKKIINYGCDTNITVSLTQIYKYCDYGKIFIWILKNQEWKFCVYNHGKTIIQWQISDI